MNDKARVMRAFLYSGILIQLWIDGIVGHHFIITAQFFQCIFPYFFYLFMEYKFFG